MDLGRDPSAPGAEELTKEGCWAGSVGDRTEKEAENHGRETQGGDQPVNQPEGGNQVGDVLGLGTG